MPAIWFDIIFLVRSTALRGKLYLAFSVKFFKAKNSGEAEDSGQGGAR